MLNLCRLWRYRWFRRAWRALFVATWDRRAFMPGAVAHMDRRDPFAVAQARVQTAALYVFLPSLARGEMTAHVARARRTVQTIL